MKTSRAGGKTQVDLLHFNNENRQLFTVILAIDTFSRYITCAKVLEDRTPEEVIKALEIAFSSEGRPRTVVTDNGSQFYTNFDTHTHPFGVFLAFYKTNPLRISPRQPRKNGIVERAVQNCKREAIRPFKNEGSITIQQRLFRWRNWYNFRRKHAGIENKRPAELFKPYYKRIALGFLKDVISEDFVGCTM
ncbi:MAG: DDE-type integrase/transposase/recombinase [Candidatus Odinarchaeota archaeon]